MSSMQQAIQEAIGRLTLIELGEKITAAQTCMLVADQMCDSQEKAYWAGVLKLLEAEKVGRCGQA